MNIRTIIPLLTLFLMTGCQHQRPWAAFEQCRSTLPGTSRQAVVVDRDESEPSGMAIRLYERNGDGWQPLGTAIPAVVGRNGLAPVGEKREGDGRTPSGIFVLERCFGYEPFATKMPYIILTPDMIWIDDVRSGRYNTLADNSAGEGFSSETMKRTDDLYKYGIVVEYNTKEIVPGAGSAIFFHIWRGPATPTAGCVAASEPDLVRLLRWLDPEKHPLAVIGDACR